MSCIMLPYHPHNCMNIEIFSDFQFLLWQEFKENNEEISRFCSIYHLEVAVMRRVLFLVKTRYRPCRLCT